LKSPWVNFEVLNGTRTLVVDWRAEGPERARVLVVPAFGDEMNQMRRMITLCAQALGDIGVSCRVFDLFGTGDSAAGFEEATPDQWIGDCVEMIGRMQGGTPLFLLGCRLGVPLALTASGRCGAAVGGVAGWAPLASGKTQLSGLLRAAAIARGQAGPEAVGDEPRAIWDAGGVAWLSGYPVSAEMARQLRCLEMPDHVSGTRIALMDIRLPDADGRVEAGVALTRQVRVWCEGGVDASVMAIAGAPFWNVADLVDVPRLIDATVGTVAGWLR
jgi:exosortase A-associated hydrolase 2